MATIRSISVLKIRFNTGVLVQKIALGGVVGNLDSMSFVAILTSFSLPYQWYQEVEVATWDIPISVLAVYPTFSLRLSVFYSLTYPMPPPQPLEHMRGQQQTLWLTVSVLPTQA